MIFHNIQNLLDLNRNLNIVMSTLQNGTFCCHIVDNHGTRIVAHGVSITLDRAAEKAMADYSEFKKPDPRQMTLES